MPFEQGNKISQGRPKGTPNRITGELKEHLAQFIVENITKLQQWMDEIKDPEEKVSAFTKLLPYILPKNHEATIPTPAEEDPDYDYMTIEELKEAEEILTRYEELKSIATDRKTNGEEPPVKWRPMF